MFLTRLPSLLATCLLTASSAAASIVSTQFPLTGWEAAEGEGTVINNVNTSSPTWGSGFPNSADNTSIYAPFSGITLAQTGDSITVTGGLELFGAQGGYDQLRIGLFNSGGSLNNRGWIGGYFFSNSHGDRAGFLRMRKNNEPDRNFMTAAGGAGRSTYLYAEDRATFTQSSYEFLLGLTRIDATSINITMSLVSVDGSYRFHHGFLDTKASPDSFYFDRMGFLSGDQLDTDQIYLRNITITHDFTPVPEPSASVLLAVLGLVATQAVRRKRIPAGAANPC